MRTAGYAPEARTGLVRLGPGETYSEMRQQFLDGRGRIVERRRIVSRLGWQHVTWTEPDPGVLGEPPPDIKGDEK